MLDLTQCHVLSVSIVAALVSARCGMWRPVVEALERQWTDPSFQRPLCSGGTTEGGLASAVSSGMDVGRRMRAKGEERCMAAAGRCQRTSD